MQKGTRKHLFHVEFSIATLSGQHDLSKGETEVEKNDARDRGRPESWGEKKNRIAYSNEE